MSNENININISSSSSSSSSIASNHSNSNNNNNNNNAGGNGNNTNISASTSNKLKASESVSNVIEKPSVPPPTLPVRPPPIGFNISIDPHSTKISDQIPSTETNVSPTSTLSRPPKPALPRKPIGNILNQFTQQQKQHQQQQQQHSDDEICSDLSFAANDTGLNSTVDVETTNNSKLSSEVTSL